MDSAAMHVKKLIKNLNDRRPPCLETLNSEVIDIDLETQTATLHFDIPLSFCHSVNIVQGGFVTAMLDAACSHAAFSSGGEISSVSTLEIKVSFLRPSRSGKFKCTAHITRIGGSIAFLEGQLFDKSGELTATASSTAKLIKPRTD